MIQETYKRTTEEAARGLRGLRVLLYGFSGAGFPGGDGVAQALIRLNTLGFKADYTHGADPKAGAILDQQFDVAIICNTRIRDLLLAPPRLWECAPKRALWFWDLRPGSVAAPLRGKVTHAFLSYNGRWKDPHGSICDPFQWRDTLGVPVGYCPQGAPLRTPRPEPHGPRVVFVGDLANPTYHAGRAEICKTLDAKVVNAKDRVGRLGVEADMPRLYPSARYCLSMSPRAPGYTSVRTYSILACGGLLVMQRFPGADKEFTSHQDCVLFDTAEDAKQKLELLDTAPDARAAIAYEGRLLHARRHTVTHRILSMLREIA